MKIVLVHPAGSNWFPGKKDITPLANRMAPLGLLSLAAYLEKKGGHKVGILDCLGPDASPDTDKNTRTIIDMKPDLVGFTATTSSFPDAAYMAESIKRELPSVITIAGGVHVSSLGATLLKEAGGMDMLCTGEGEETLAEVASGREPKSINGLAFRDNGKTRQNPPRVQLPEMDSLPFPAYHRLRGFPHEYRLPLFSYTKTPGASFVTSRGCPFTCSYCDRSVFGRSYRFNSAEYTFEHFKFLKREFSVRHVTIYDDLFTVNKKRIFELCDMLASSDMDMEFNCAVRIGSVDMDLLRALKAGGCLMVSFGIESGHQPLLDRHKAGVKLEQVRKTVAMAKQAGLWVKGLFMVGLPGETDESIRKTGDFAQSLDLDDLNYSKFTPFPGAPVWADIESHGEFIQDWRLMNCLNFVFRPNEIESFDRLEDLYREQVSRFYSSKSWRKKLMKRAFVHRNSLWRLLRNLPDFIAAKKNFQGHAT
ncbi:MAG: radical SAM protein [Deltaproteobacteria bacterium]|nr:radical SAM protein [Deltaproteobacteria bacterium]